MEGDLNKTQKGVNIMKKLLVLKDDILGRKAEVNVKKIYETEYGKWIAEVDASEVRSACLELCRGIKNCSCENIHGETDLDDDGKEYRIVPT